jgi:ADP-L-glycero-D-manno-heptose 6-epimerase
MGRQPEIEYCKMPESIRDQYQYFTEAQMDKLASAGNAMPFRSLENSVSDYVVNYLIKGEKYL